MTPGSLDLVILQGSTFKRIIRLTDATPAAIDLTGCTARMHIRQTISDTETLIELTEANGRATITDEAGGEITLLIEDEDTAALDFTKGVYDLEIEYWDGTVDRVLEGKVKLSKEVTR
jgi:hypothetical protein